MAANGLEGVGWEESLGSNGEIHEPGANQPSVRPSLPTARPKTHPSVSLLLLHVLLARMYFPPFACLPFSPPSIQTLVELVRHIPPDTECQQRKKAHTGEDNPPAVVYLTGLALCL